LTDTLDTLKSYITANWTASNTGSRTPTINLRHDKKQLNLRNGDYVTLNYVGKIRKARNAFGYVTLEKKVTVQIDVWTSFSDAQSQLMSAEVERLMMNLRNDSTNNGGFEIFEPPNIDDFRDAYRRMFRWALTFELWNVNAAVLT